MIRTRVVVHGSVQGVGFRYSVMEMARTRRVAGWVKNNRDGTVEAVFEGEPGAVDSLLRFCQEGPRGAEVEHVDVTQEEPEGLSEFGLGW